MNASNVAALPAPEGGRGHLWPRRVWWIQALALGCFGVVVVRNAWLSDDAYITFRTVDNFVHGYGLTWNVSERVQAYTHPLWMFLFTGVYAVTREAFFTAHVLSIVISLVAVFVLLRWVAAAPAALVVALALSLSKAFVDYSSSGLENPLTHLLLGGFLAVYFRGSTNSKRSFWLSALAALILLNRMDLGLLCLPALAYALIERRLRDWRIALAGFVPFVIWEAFATFYYGSPFPNTALAKLNAGVIPDYELMRQGVSYLLNSLLLDPLTLACIGLAISAPFLLPVRRMMAPALGLVLYLAYIVRIGGDFMSGRFLAAPFLWALGMLCSGLLLRCSGSWPLLAGLTLVLGALAPASPVFTAPEQRIGFDPGGWASHHGISDEGANYFSSTGLLMALRKKDLPDHDWAREGRQARTAGPMVVERGSVGFYGYFAGPQVHVVDLLALADPLLARLPPADRVWRIGHFGRIVPDGYLETLATGENRIRNPDLARYYDKLSYVTRGPLFSLDRLVEIWKLNTGAYDRYLEAYAYARGPQVEMRFRVTNPTHAPFVYAYVWNNGAAAVVLLDDASEQGKSYLLHWEITAAGARFEAPHLSQPASLGALSDAETLNVGVYFNPQPGNPVGAMYEHRFAFRLRRNHGLTVVLPGTEWYNPDPLQGGWLPQDVDPVLSPVAP